MKPLITIRRTETALRECLPLRDMTDCLLQAYDCVARRAYQKFLSRGGQPGGELHDWLDAERELLGNLPVNLVDGGEALSALASLPGLSSEQVDVGIDPRWLVILGQHNAMDESVDQSEGNTDFDQVAAWVSTIHRDARTLRIPCRGARSPGSSTTRQSPPSLPPQLSANSDLAVVADGPDENSEHNSSKSQSAAGNEGGLEPSQPSGAPAAWQGSSAEYGPEPGQGNAASQLICVLELPAEIDPSRCAAVLANGLLAIRMPKRKSSAH
jgi:HSP20 family molecular chaperone IbpA